MASDTIGSICVVPTAPTTTRNQTIQKVCVVVTASIETNDSVTLSSEETPASVTQPKAPKSARTYCKNPSSKRNFNLQPAKLYPPSTVTVTGITPPSCIAPAETENPRFKAEVEIRAACKTIVTQSAKASTLANRFVTCMKPQLFFQNFVNILL